MDRLVSLSSRSSIPFSSSLSSAKSSSTFVDSKAVDIEGENRDLSELQQSPLHTRTRPPAVVPSAIVSPREALSTRKQAPALAADSRGLGKVTDSTYFRHSTSKPGGSRSVSGDTLVEPSAARNYNASEENSKKLLDDSVAALDIGWTLFEESEDYTPQNNKDRKRQSRRLGMVVETMASTLGKRTRAAYESTKEVIGNSVASLTGDNNSGNNNKRASLRRRSAAVVDPNDENDQPPQKKRRSAVASLFAFAEDKVEAAPPPKPQALKKKNKRWLTRGLYAGQKQDFEVARIKNKGKDSSDASAPKRNPYLPMPMFGFLDRERDFKLPYDIFNALPKGQPKPDEWKKTRSNQFVGDSKEVWKHMNSKMEDSKCLCQHETGCDDDCINRCMYYECDENNCAVGPAYCNNRQFADLKERVKKGSKYDIGVEVQKYQNKGFGVRACRTFEPHQIIVEYSGEIITQEECEDRMHTVYKNKSDYYLMTFDQNMIIDATRGSIARFVNHSCAPNCAMVKWTVHNKPRMALFALDQGIMTGDELTYDYNFDPFSMKNVQACHCGAAECRGFLGPRPSKTKDTALSIATATVNGVKRKMSELVGGKTKSPSQSPTKKTGYVRGPYKKRRVSEPAPALSRKQSAKGGRKVQRTVSSASDKTLVDKENTTPSTKSGRSSSGSGTPAGDFVVRRTAVSVKREAPSASAKGLQQTQLESWLSMPGAATIKRAVSKTLGSKAKGDKRAGQIEKQKKKKQKKQRMSMPAKLPAPQVLKAKAEEEDGWVANGVKGKGKWKFELKVSVCNGALLLAGYCWVFVSCLLSLCISLPLERCVQEPREFVSMFEATLFLRQAMRLGYEEKRAHWCAHADHNTPSAALRPQLFSHLMSRSRAGRGWCSMQCWTKPAPYPLWRQSTASQFCSSLLSIKTKTVTTTATVTKTPRATIYTTPTSTAPAVTVVVVSTVPSTSFFTTTSFVSSATRTTYTATVTVTGTTRGIETSAPVLAPVLLPRYFASSDLSSGCSCLSLPTPTKTATATTKITAATLFTRITASIVRTTPTRTVTKTKYSEVDITKTKTRTTRYAVSTASTSTVGPYQTVDPPQCSPSYFASVNYEGFYLYFNGQRSSGYLCNPFGEYQLYRIPLSSDCYLAILDIANGFITGSTNDVGTIGGLLMYVTDAVQGSHVYFGSALIISQNAGYYRPQCYFDTFDVSSTITCYNSQGQAFLPYIDETSVNSTNSQALGFAVGQYPDNTDPAIDSGLIWQAG
ncbi:hypothetical protein FH972_023910 [Carpinus fangiana]|uniref:Histone-lysine N-methyltransferase n=1 Tax=Carpinus fangiana TaxID=176857 RepID=A0A5N6KWS8_9ROSI|nr:hypothetical protein FH972_023910 [Carpinus fangiana]